MKYLILGGVAAGTKTAAKLKRENRGDEVVILTKSADISYAGCGLPYYIGGAIESREELIVNTPAKFSKLTGVEVLTGMEAVSVDPEAKTVAARSVENGGETIHSYDKLIIATGASAVVPPIEGADKQGIFTLRTPDDAEAIRTAAAGAKQAVVVGGGFIGLEVAENLKAKGLRVTVVDVADQVLPNVVDFEIARYVRRRLTEAGIRVLTSTKVVGFQGGASVTAVATDKGTLPCELAVLSVGIRPNTAFLKVSGIEMDRGTILVDEKLATSVADIYAVGDCVQVTNRVTGQRQWSAMGSSANLEGRTLARILNGTETAYPGVLGTGVVKLPGFNVGRTGLTEAQAKKAGYDAVSVLSVADDKAHYYPGAGTFATKLIADRATHQILGIQVVGEGPVDKMVDIAVTAISMKAKLEDLENCDFAYAPPFSTAIHPFALTVQMLLNKLDGTLVSMTPGEYLEGKAEGYTVIETGTAQQIRGSRFVNFTEVNGPIEGIAPDEKLLLVCRRGKQAYFLQNRLRSFGYTDTVVLEGASYFSEVRVKQAKAGVSAEEIARVKALGCLWDKNTADHFNVRVITRNGKITADESRAIAEAATLFGSGEIAMTSRLTVEIQGVPFDNIEPLREHLAGAGLETGGTGSKVRPVVSCKGTTCQYGLIDTFSLSEEIHERFFHGYAGVKLPHKFKIAVGGCPNNCVKPALNDLGIIGQRVPEIDQDRCRGCKKCQIEQACPINVAHLVDGKLKVDPEACNHCGRCIGKCPFKAVENYTNGYRIYIGGRWGKKVARGRYLDKVFTDREEVMQVVEKAILLFREQGITGERFNDTVNRLGFENVQEQLLSDELLTRKEENLTAQKHLKGGATC